MRFGLYTEYRYVEPQVSCALDRRICSLERQLSVSRQMVTLAFLIWQDFLNIHFDFSRKYPNMVPWENIQLCVG